MPTHKTFVCTVTGADGQPIKQLPRRGRTLVTLCLTDKATNEALAGLICEIQVIGEDSPLCLCGAVDAQFKQASPFCNGRGEVRITLGFDQTNRPKRVGLMVRPKVPATHKQSTASVPKEYRAKKIFFAVRPENPEQTDEETGDPFTSPTPVPRPPALPLRQMIRDEANCTSPNASAVATRQLPRRVLLNLQAVNGAPPPSVPHGGLSDLMVAMVMIDGKPGALEHLHLLLSSDNGGLVFKSANGETIGDELTLTADANGRSPPFRLAHNGLRPDRLGKMYLTQRDLAVGTTVHIVNYDTVLTIEATEAPVVPVQATPWDDETHNVSPTARQRLDALYGAQRPADWDGLIFDRNGAESHLPLWAQRHSDLNDPYFMYGDPEAEERRERAEDPRREVNTTELQAPDYFLIFCLWFILGVITIVGLGLTIKAERWDSLNPAQKEAIGELVYLTAKPWFEAFEEWVDPAQKPSIKAPPPAEPTLPPSDFSNSTAPKRPSNEKWIPFHYPPVPLLPPSNADPKK